ncbi:hypothetical protein GCM10027286_17980 [Virgibacillus ainsalahensis]
MLKNKADKRKGSLEYRLFKRNRNKVRSRIVYDTAYFRPIMDNHIKNRII